MSGRNGGRHRIPINWTDFDKLCALQCTKEEIASFFECSIGTILRAVKREKKIDFVTYYEQKAQHGRRSLRRKMYEIAMNGNTAMLIWLSKQKSWLGFKDQIDSKQDVNVNQNKIVYVTEWGNSSIDESTERPDPSTESTQTLQSSQ